MADAAERLPEPEALFDDAQGPRIVPISPGVPDPALGVERRAEGGLTLRFAFDLPKLPHIMAVNTWTHQQLMNGALILAVLLLAGYLVFQSRSGGEAATPPAQAPAAAELRSNVAASFNPTLESPVVGGGTYVDPMASVIGHVVIGSGVFVAPFASIRGDEGQPIHIGDGSNVQDFVMLHALETFAQGKLVEKNLVSVGGEKYAVYIGANVSLAHQSQVHGPAAVGDNTFVGMQALVFKAVVGKNVVIEPGARVIGVTIADGRYVPAGKTVSAQADADALPAITADYPFATLNEGVLHVNHEFADGYLQASGGGHAGSSGQTRPGATGGHSTAGAPGAGSGH